MAVAVQNGSHPHKFIDNIDTEDPEYVKDMLRPPEVKEDVRLMTQRRRVSLILKSAAFRKELEKITATHMKDGELNPTLAAINNLINYLTPHAKLGTSAFTRCTTIPVIPINDLKQSDLGATMSKSERLIRCKAAAVFRLMDMLNWNNNSSCGNTAKIYRQEEEYLVNPHGLLFNEVTASSMVKVNLSGAVLHGGTLDMPIDKPGWLLHSAIYAAKTDVRCVVHLSTTATIAVSSLPTGLLPLSQEAMILGEVAVYKTQHGLNVNEEIAAIASCLNVMPESCRVLLVKNCGLLVFGMSIEETWFNAYNAVLACDAQLRLSCIAGEELVLPSEDSKRKAHEVGRSPARVQMMGVQAGGGWRPGELEFEAFMRRLDAAGCQTGHLYRITQLKQPSGALRRAVVSTDTPLSTRRSASLSRSVKGLREDVEVPPTCSSFQASFYGDSEARNRAAIKAKSMSLQRTHWLNTPNAYQKVQIKESGTADPKTITLWTREKEKLQTTLTSGVSMATEDPNLFAPQGINPKELKLNQMKVKSKYYSNVRNAGPKSKILDGLEDEAELGNLPPGSPPTSPGGTLLRLDPNSPPSVEPGHVVLVGAVSKGIIQDKVRHNVSAYQSVYSPNPFDHVTDEDLERYKCNVDRKSRGLLTMEEEEARAAVRRQLEAEKAAEVAKKAAEAAKLEEASTSTGSPKKRLFPGKLVKSDTSGADEATEETDKETRDGKEKKKKRRFKLPSFHIKSKKRDDQH